MKTRRLPVFLLFAEAGIRVASTNHRIEAAAATTEDAALLGVRRSSPLLQVGRTTTTREGRLVELGVDRYRAGAIAFEIEVAPAYPIDRLRLTFLHDRHAAVTETRIEAIDG